jgi:hypothetical protein
LLRSLCAFRKLKQRRSRDEFAVKVACSPFVPADLNPAPKGHY